MNKKQKKVLESLMQKTKDLQNEVEALLADISKDMPDPKKPPALIKAKKEKLVAAISKAEAELAVARKANKLGRELEFDDPLICARNVQRDLGLAIAEKIRKIANRKTRGREQLVNYLKDTTWLLENRVLDNLRLIGKEK